MLAVRQISKAFSDFKIKEVSFEVEPGEYFVLLGPSGVGKSVLLEIIVGLIRPDAGRIFLDGKDITDEKIQNRQITLVFQNSTLFPHMTVYDNIAYPLRYKGFNNSQIRRRVVQLARDFAIGYLLNRSPRTLSGGECQRVSLARAVASRPKCLLLDEPMSSLDVTSGGQIRALLRKISAWGQPIVHVTHNYMEAVSLATHIAVMEDGRIVQSGRVAQVFHYPKSEFVARFVGIRNFFRGRLEKVRDGQLRRFRTAGLDFSILSDSPAGNGFVCIRSEDVTISNASGQTGPPNVWQTSARNNFEGRIVDIIPTGPPNVKSGVWGTPAGGGIEVIVDIGVGNPVEIAALITGQSLRQLALRKGKKVWVSFKASAIQYVEE